MDRPGAGSSATKEPIRKPWIWILLAIIVLAGVPWYLPAGTIEPVILGVPYWLLISVFFSFVLCGYLSWLCLTQWDVVEAEEEAQSGGTERAYSEGQEE